MIKLLKKYGVELKLKKCDLFRLIEGQKDTFLEDGFAFKMTNEEEMFKYEVILNGIYNKTKIEGEYKKFVYETQDASSPPVCKRSSRFSVSPGWVIPLSVGTWRN